MWKIDKDDFSTINQLGYNVAKIVKQLLSTSTVQIMASFSSSFNSSKLKLAHVNLCFCRNKEMEISLFLKENNIDILILNETWFKSNFKRDIPN